MNATECGNKSQVKGDRVMMDMPWTVYYGCGRTVTFHFSRASAYERLDRHTQTEHGEEGSNAQA